MKIYESFQEACIQVIRRPRDDDQRFRYGHVRGSELAAGGWEFPSWKPLADVKGMLSSTVRLSYVTTSRGYSCNTASGHVVVATPVEIVALEREKAYWVDWYAVKEYTLHPLNRAGYLSTRRISEHLDLAYFESKWDKWAWALDEPMAWYAEVEGERCVFIWGGYDGQGYDVKVKRYIEEMFPGVVLEGPRTRVPLSEDVDLVLYAHPDVRPSLSIHSSLRGVRETELTLSALRRGRDLQELLERL